MSPTEDRQTGSSATSTSVPLDALVSRNPATGDVVSRVPLLDAAALEAALTATATAARDWRATSVAERAITLRRLADTFDSRRDSLAETATREMGKPLAQARAEVDKCASACRYYAEHGARILADRVLAADSRDARIVWQPLGVILLVMPWNFPYWQVVRQAMVATLAGNTVLLKHASNVPGCGQALHDVFAAAMPESVFTYLPVATSEVATILADLRVRGVSLTGSETAGAAVASVAGQHLKPSVLELGGSDPFIVLDDVDLDAVVELAVKARFQNNGETCIAAKRFLVHAAVHDAFVERFVAATERLVVGDPMDAATDVGPLARVDLVDDLVAQIDASTAAGARLLTGGRRPDRAATDCFLRPAVLDRVRLGMRVFDEETFGPCAAITVFESDAEAIELANRSRYGLGGSVWSPDLERAERIARALDCGCAFVNGIVRSDPRLPFGGVKDSGFGRELSDLGVYAFCNAKTLWLGDAP